MTTWFITVRAVHIGACLLFFGMHAFDRGIMAAVSDGGKMSAADYWQTRLRFISVALLPVILLSGIGWFLFVVITMSGQSLALEAVKVVWTQTQFGVVCQWRFGIWMVAVLATVPLPKKDTRWRWLQFFAGSGLVGSLAWAGHGREDAVWHLWADTLHLLVAGFWPAGLLPLFLILRKLRHAGSPDVKAVALLVRRFSAISLASVALLAITGLINSWFLVGSLENLIHSGYGQWLMIKIALFGITLLIGAVNLLRLKPQITLASLHSENTVPQMAQLYSNVRTELFIGTLVIIIVAIMGILPPPGH